MDAWPGSRSGGYRVIRFRERATNVIRATFTANCPKLSKHCVQTCSFAIRCQQVSGSPTEKRFVVSENIKIYFTLWIISNTLEMSDRVGLKIEEELNYPRVKLYNTKNLISWTNIFSLFTRAMNFFSNFKRQVGKWIWWLTRIIVRRIKTINYT